MKQINACLFFFICLIICSCISIPNQHSSLPPGIWRGVIYINEYSNIIVTEGRKEVVTRDVNFEDKSLFIPFNFEIKEDSLHHLHMTVINANEKIHFDQINIGRDPKTGDDTFRINLAPYDACLKGVFQEDKMRGYFVVLDKPNYFMPFEAHFGLAHRFQKTPAPVAVNVSGTYQAMFSDTTGDSFNAIGEFEQIGAKVTGTFRTETGDFRYLQGEIDSNKLLLSCFDGSHAFLFRADISGDSLVGSFYSGKHYKASWIAYKNPSAKLRSGDSISFSLNPQNAFKFNFMTPDSSWINFESEFFKNKIKVVQVLGSWCPNCRDESEFLNQYIKDFPDKRLEIVGLAFERKGDLQKAMNRVALYKKNLNLNYPIAYGGVANRDTAAAVLGNLNGIFAFPTTLFIDRRNQIYKIHSGFDGPATSQFENYKKEFHKTISFLLDQK